MKDVNIQILSVISVRKQNRGRRNKQKRRETETKNAEDDVWHHQITGHIRSKGKWKKIQCNKKTELNAKPSSTNHRCQVYYL